MALEMIFATLEQFERHSFYVRELVGLNNIGECLYNARPSVRPPVAVDGPKLSKRITRECTTMHDCV